MEFKTTFRFYQVDKAPYVGAYAVGSMSEGEPTIMFAMDFHTWTLKDVAKEELTDAFKDGMLQTVTHEFCHSMQEFLDKEFDELEVETIMGQMRPHWNVFEAPLEDPALDSVFPISDFLNWLDHNKANSAEELRTDINSLFMGHRLWIEAEEKNKREKASSDV